MTILSGFTRRNYSQRNANNEGSGGGTPTAPTNTVAPSLVGSGLIGSPITVNLGSWGGFPSPTFTYDWKRGGISTGITTSTYTPAYPADNSGVITCDVTGTNGSGFLTVPTSNSITVETYTAPSNTVAPVVSGTGNFGDALTTTNGTWTGNPTPSFTYQWQRNGSNIGGATTNSYTPTYPVDNNAAIRCVVTATNAVSAVSANSNAISTPNYTTPANTVAPVISGTGNFGDTLTSTTGTWTGNPTPTYTYQWKRGGVDISGATSNSYVPAYPADNNASITCQVTGTNTAGSANATSNAISTPNYVIPTNTVAPTVSGSTAYGSVLTTSNGTWTANPSPTYSYAWKRNGSTISGEIASTYTTLLTDVGFAISSTVTATNVVGANSANSSNSITVTSGAPAYDEAFIITCGMIISITPTFFTENVGFDESKALTLGALDG